MVISGSRIFSPPYIWYKMDIFTSSLETFWVKAVAHSDGEMSGGIIFSGVGHWGKKNYMVSEGSHDRGGSSCLGCDISR